MAQARRGLQAIINDYRQAYPSAMAVIERDLDALAAHLRWPSEHRKPIRTTNLLERTFVEVRRRTKVIGRFPRRDLGAVTDLGRTRTLKPRLARRRHDPKTVAEIERLRHQHGSSARSNQSAGEEEVVAA